MGLEPYSCMDKLLNELVWDLYIYVIEFGILLILVLDAKHFSRRAIIRFGFRLT